jgi:hypothetical protein
VASIAAAWRWAEAGSRRLALITYAGRWIGRRRTIPVGYELVGDELVITVAAPQRKVWWRNLTGSERRSSWWSAAAR